MITSLFTEFDVVIYPNPFSAQEKPIRYGLIRIAREKWPHEKLVTLIRQLPPTVRVMIDPDKIV